MAEKPALAAGIAAASIAAIVAATPAVITNPNKDVQIAASAEAPIPLRTVTAEQLELMAFTDLRLSDLLLAVGSGYVNRNYDVYQATLSAAVADAIAAAEEANGSTDLTPDEIAAITAETTENFDESDFTVAGGGGGVYYLVDTILPDSINHDDDLFTQGWWRAYYRIADDLGIDREVVNFILQPILTPVRLVFGEDSIVYAFVAAPVQTTLTVLGSLLGSVSPLSATTSDVTSFSAFSTGAPEIEGTQAELKDEKAEGAEGSENEAQPLAELAKTFSSKFELGAGLFGKSAKEAVAGVTSQQTGGQVDEIQEKGSGVTPEVDGAQTLSEDVKDDEKPSDANDLKSKFDSAKADFAAKRQEVKEARAAAKAEREAQRAERQESVKKAFGLGGRDAAKGPDAKDSNTGGPGGGAGGGSNDGGGNGGGGGGES